MFFLTNPFFDAYIESDLLGRMIFIGLIILSICSWIIMLHKLWVTYHVRRNAEQFYSTFQGQKANLLNLDYEMNSKKRHLNPFFELYAILKRHTLDILNKNRKFGKGESSESAPSYLSQADIDFVDAHLMSAIANQTKCLEKNLFILSTVVSLGPFLGLLGTVWGILTTFSEMQMQTGGGSTSQMVLGGLSLALATTVLGLLDAIPALIGYNYLKNTTNAFQTEMEGFATEILAAVEIQYRKVETFND